MELRCDTCGTELDSKWIAPGERCVRCFEGRLWEVFPPAEPERKERERHFRVFIRSVREWLSIRLRHDPVLFSRFPLDYPPSMFVNQLCTDMEHSTLLYRMAVLGRPPFRYPPPVYHSYPVYPDDPGFRQSVGRIFREWCFQNRFQPGPVEADDELRWSATGPRGDIVLVANVDPDGVTMSVSAVRDGEESTVASEEVGPVDLSTFVSGLLRKASEHLDQEGE